MPFTAFHRKMAAAHRKLKLKPGDIYEDCAYHPVLCLGVDYTKDEIWGVSLVDGTYPRSCSLIHCGVRKLTPRQAWEIKLRGPVLEAGIAPFSTAKQWWSESGGANEWRVGMVGPRKQKPARSVQIRQVAPTDSLKKRRTKVNPNDA